MAYIGRRRPGITNLPLTNAPGAAILEDNPRRVALIFKNAGTGAVYVSDQQDNITAANGWPIDPGETFNPATSPIAPQNELYAVGDAGHDLRIFETVMNDRAVL